MTTKKLVLILAVCAVGVIGATAAQGFDPGRGLTSVVGKFTTVTASGLITANGGVALGASQDLTCVGATGATCIYDELGATCGTRTDDANAANRSINSSNVSPFAAAAKTPGNLVLQGGLDSKTVTCAVATCDGTDTVIVTRNINGTSTANTLTFGTDFCTAGSCTTDDLMATSLAAAINALTGVGSTSLSDVVGVTADRQTYSIVLTDSNAHAACTVLSNGTNGAVAIVAPSDSGGAGTPLCQFTSSGSVIWTDCATNTLATSKSLAGSGLYTLGGITAAGASGTIAAQSTITSSSTTTIGWSKQSAANQACTTTCTSACVFGQDTATWAIVDCADATADVCICAGST